MSQMSKIGSTATNVSHGPYGYLSVRYHDTIVVNVEKALTTSDTLYTVTLNSDGYRTMTTKKRMNQASNEFKLGYQVFQRKNKWFVDVNGEELEFRDNMQFLIKKG